MMDSSSSGAAMMKKETTHHPYDISNRTSPTTTDAIITTTTGRAAETTESCCCWKRQQQDDDIEENHVVHHDHDDEIADDTVTIRHEGGKEGEETTSSLGHNNNIHHHQHQHQQHVVTNTKKKYYSKKQESSTMEEEEEEASILASAETKKINILRILVLILLLSIAALATTGVYIFTVQQESTRFEIDFTTNAAILIDNFYDAIERRLGAASSLSNTLTSFANATNQQFPFVTLPNFEVLGSDLRIQAAALIVHWMPLVHDTNRNEWEEYAFQNRYQIDQTFKDDTTLRLEQDIAFGYTTTASGNGGSGRMLEEEDPPPPPPPPVRNETILDDGTGYHPKIWSIGSTSPRGDQPLGHGPYLPLWQRSPMNGLKQNLVNMDFKDTLVFDGLMEKLLKTSEAIMNKAVVPTATEGKQSLATTLAISQFRFNAEQYLDDPITFLAYPVFDSFDLTQRQVVGVLALNLYWRRFFTQILPPSAIGYVCVIENSYGQTLAYRLDGPEAVFLGQGTEIVNQYIDSEFEYLVMSADINEFVQQQASPETRSYTTVPLNKEFGKYTLRIYPTVETKEHFQSNKPWVYCVVVLTVFLLTMIILTCLDRVVARRQQIVMDRVVKTAEDAAAFERDLNAFLAHEVRNPIAAALSAHGFVADAVANLDTLPPSIKEVEGRDNNSVDSLLPTLLGDVAIIGSSLYFVDDFLRSILDMHASEENKLHVQLAPADLLKDVLDPVRSILHQRDTGIEVQVECPENLLVMTDSLRLKQIILNLGRNSTKFTTKGFIRFRAAVVDNLVELYVEDSGGGIPEEKRGDIFQRFQPSLDELSQGTGLGLSLCETLVTLLQGSISLDNDYTSGMVGDPGTRFVVQLKTAPIPPETILDSVPIVDESISCAQKNQGSGGSGASSTDQTSLGAAHDDEDDQEEKTLELSENLSVLFVDDDTVLRKLFSRAVKKAAPTWKISEAASGEAAIQLIEDSHEEFDIIFMDQYMTSTQKQMVGTEAVRVLRSKGVSSIIFGLSANDIEEGFLNSGADGFILKPLPCKPEAMRAELVRITHGL